MRANVFSQFVNTLASSFELARYYGTRALLDPEFFQIPIHSYDSSFRRNIVSMFNNFARYEQPKVFNSLQRATLEGGVQKPPSPIKFAFDFLSKNGAALLSRASALGTNPVFIAQTACLVLLVALCDETTRTMVNEQLTHAANYLSSHFSTHSSDGGENSAKTIVNATEKIKPLHGSGIEHQNTIKFWL